MTCRLWPKDKGHEYGKQKLDFSARLLGLLSMMGLLAQQSRKALEYAVPLHWEEVWIPNDDATQFSQSKENNWLSWQGHYQSRHLQQLPHKAVWLNLIAQHNNIWHTWGDELEKIHSKSSSMLMNCVTCFNCMKHFSRFFMIPIAMLLGNDECLQ